MNKERYFIYNDKIYKGKYYEIKWDTYKFHNPTSKALQDYIYVYSLYVAEDVETLKDNILNWIVWLKFKN